ncbi:ATPase/protein kinase [Psychroflexus planctonicus]|uniref:ATPase/protein kinase n=1 Tax=Psychroflexus planctonicus TaxID=1526575 RepID=A0ABQ1SGA6_9FLAO|nr:ATPase/protein kinase [Psychroflexus planctonicus]
MLNTINLTSKKKSDFTSALGNSEATSRQNHISEASKKRIRAIRKQVVNPDEIIQGLLAGNKTQLSKAITLIESSAQKHESKVKQIIAACLPHANQSIRIGITGVPGVGKSTFIESFGNFLINQGKKVAVLAVDPSSSVSGGSILGDKTRMEELVKSEQAFIRPTASGDSLGGVARKTRESIILCEAAGFDVILIETVGVGQSETAVHSMTDFFLLLKLAGAGDELQGIKRGIIEMADAILINKADGNNEKAAKHAKAEFKRALHLYPEKQSQWTPKVKLCSALNNVGVEDVWKMLSSYFEKTKSNGFFEENRKLQNKYWLLQSINEQLKNRFYNHPKIKEELKIQLEKIHLQETTPFEAADYLLGLKR